MTADELIEFEKDISSEYLAGLIRGPIHLRDGNEESLIEIFDSIGDEDYVFSTWANHLHALLKEIPKEKIKERILQGNSMAMNFPEHKFYTSAIVGGICPIAIGVAEGIKRQGKNNRVYIFIGDMTSFCGIANECLRYSINHDLPITWIVEDNGKSVSTPTRSVWNEDTSLYVEEFRNKIKNKKMVDIIYYEFNSTFPHSGVGYFVQF